MDCTSGQPPVAVVSNRVLAGLAGFYCSLRRRGGFREDRLDGISSPGPICLGPSVSRPTVLSAVLSKRGGSEPCWWGRSAPHIDHLINLVASWFQWSPALPCSAVLHTPLNVLCFKSSTLRGRGSSAECARTAVLSEGRGSALAGGSTRRGSGTAPPTPPTTNGKFHGPPKTRTGKSLFA